MDEMALHKIIVEDKSVQASILNLLNIDSSYEFKHEDQYPNGLKADFSIVSGNTVKGIIECKGSDIGVNDFVRGIGQVMEYQHFADNNLSSKGYEYDKAVSIYLFPSSIIKNKNFNIGLFGYPEKCRIIEYNEINNGIREITQKELVIFADAQNSNKITISQYYIRDNRLFELYICLKYVLSKKICGFKNVDRRQAEMDFLRKIETPNNNNWRNAFISLSSLGLIDSNNLPTPLGAKYATMEYEEFAYEIYNSYIRVYLDLLVETILKKSDKSVNITYDEIKKMLTEEFNGKEILFMTDSDNRYLSSWMNILRDDYGAVDFASRSNWRTVKYKIFDLNRDTIISKIKMYSIAYQYIEKFHSEMSK